MKKYLVPGFLLLVGCYSRAPQPVYVPVPVPVQDYRNNAIEEGEYEVEEEEEEEVEEDEAVCDCDNWDYLDCYDIDYETECEQEIEDDPYSLIEEYDDATIEEDEEEEESNEYSPNCDCDDWDHYECDELDYEIECN